MISEKKIEQLVKEVIADNIYIVDVNISLSNEINVYIDSNEGVKIADCITVSRNIEENLDRDSEDFELYVSSPGLHLPFKVAEQYIKYLNQEVEVILKTGIKISGKLVKYEDNSIEVEETKKERVEGHKKKQTVITNHKLKLSDIKSTKVIISFK